MESNCVRSSPREALLHIGFTHFGVTPFEGGFINIQEVLRQLAESVVNETMSAVENQLCSATRNSRNGYRERRLGTCMASPALRIPKLRS